jgi:hypothetical protein
MKPKMDEGEKPAEAGVYMCIWCDTNFAYTAGKLACPNCQNALASDLVVIYLEEDPGEDPMYCQVEFHGG